MSPVPATQLFFHLTAHFARLHSNLRPTQKRQCNQTSASPLHSGTEGKIGKGSRRETLRFKTPGKRYAVVRFKIASERPAIITGTVFAPSELASEVTFPFALPNHRASALFNPLDISCRFRI